uniref:Uncharacterized protein n=1 Tax=Tanacetum cinerariifolium TaxID=118510 RepID=A0A6L2NDC6_TANCI|nr:hypothetical protein [Tanacetum cinerariifolium]
MQQKEETFQVIIDVKDLGSYEFLLANKKCVVNVEVFRKILDICPRVKGEEFTEVQDDDATLTFLIDLGYKGLLHKYTNIGKGSQGKKTADVSQELVDVYEESEPEPAKEKTGSRSSRGVVIQDPPSAPKSKPAVSKLKLKGTGGSSEGSGRIPRVLVESTVVSATSKNESEHSDDSQLNFDVKEKKDNDGDADDKGDDHINDIQDTDDEYVETKSDEDEIHMYKIHVHKDVDVEMAKAEIVKHMNKEKDEMTNAAKADLRVAKLEKDVSELKKIDHSIEALATLKSQVPNVVEYYLGSKIGDDLQKICKIKREQAEKQKMPKYTIKSTDKATIKEMKMPWIKGFADTVKNHKRHHDDDDEEEDPSAGPNQGKKIKTRRTKESESSKKPSITKETPKGKASSKGSKMGKSAYTKESVKEPIAEVAMDDAVNTAGKDMVRNDDQPQDTSEPKTYKTPNQDWFKQPLRPPTPDTK